MGLKAPGTFIKKILRPELGQYRGPPRGFGKQGETTAFNKRWREVN